MEDVRLIHGDCLSVLPTLPSASVECVLTDPPYPCIKRPYGYWTEAEWFQMMRVVVPECMRILKPTGSAVFILQPNSERVGRMRTWLWEFMTWVGKEWGIVQDAYWWNTSAPPNKHANRTVGLMRPSLKTSVWIGSANCWRDQDAVLWEESLANAAGRATKRATGYRPYGGIMNEQRCSTAAVERGGVTPFNVLPVPNANSSDSAGSHGHNAGTAEPICNWWLRYICPPGGSVLDPFSGSGTVALAALKQGKKAIGIERVADYHATAKNRIADALNQTPLFADPKP